jgi:hypothetical protein
MGIELPLEQPEDGADALCLKCFEEGESRTRTLTIAGFRDLLVQEFECANCGFRCVRHTAAATAAAAHPAYGRRERGPPLPPPRPPPLPSPQPPERRSTEAQFAGQFGETGVRYELVCPAGATAALARQASSRTAWT